MVDGLRARLAAALVAVARFVRPAPRLTVFCTGVSASWCPIHGDCACRPPCHECGGENVGEIAGGAFRLFGCSDCGAVFERDDLYARSDSRCPLHALTSDHATGETED